MTDQNEDVRGITQDESLARKTNWLWVQAGVGLVAGVVIAVFILKDADIVSSHKLFSADQPQVAVNAYRLTEDMETEYLAEIDQSEPEDIVLKVEAEKNGFITIFRRMPFDQNEMVVKNFKIMANQPTFIGEGDDILILTQSEVARAEGICWIYGKNQSEAEAEWKAFNTGTTDRPLKCLGMSRKD